MVMDLHYLLEKYPPAAGDHLKETIRSGFMSANVSLVVLDDDPTGTQTVHNTPVLTRWDTATLEREFRNKVPLFYLLTNSRGMCERDAMIINTEIARNLSMASSLTGRRFIVISRSDSTLRGHYPAETDALAGELFTVEPFLFFIPAFTQGGRVTINSQHYLAGENNTVIPVSETDYARDSAFGFSSSRLTEYIVEKSAGKISSCRIRPVTLDKIRSGGPEEVYRILDKLQPGDIVVPDAADTSDLEILATAFWKWYDHEKPVLFRTAASIIPVLAGMEPREMLNKSDFETRRPGLLIVAGSYVPLTTRQLDNLSANLDTLIIELPVTKVLDQSDPLLEKELARKISGALEADKIVVFQTSRELVRGITAEDSLRIVNRVSQAVVSTVSALDPLPGIIIAKGGITSSDIATRALKIEKAMVKGQVLAGVPVWTLGPESRSPATDYVVFPGNVGDESSITKAVKTIRGILV